MARSSGGFRDRLLIFGELSVNGTSDGLQVGRIIDLDIELCYDPTRPTALARLL